MLGAWLVQAWRPGTPAPAPAAAPAATPAAPAPAPATPSAPATGPEAPAPAAAELGIAGERFTLDGQPRFLTFISYFDAPRAASLESDLDFIRHELGFDGIRVFPNWWVYDRQAQPCPAARDDTLFEAGGAVRGDATPATGPLARLLRVLDEAGRRGLVVDLSFARETVPGGMAVEPYRRALQRTAFLLRGQRHVLFDLQNERDLDRPPMHLTPAEVEGLRAAVKDPELGDPSRLVVASTTGVSPPLGGRGPDDPASTVGFVRTIGLDAVAYHDPRGPGWAGPGGGGRRRPAPGGQARLSAGAVAVPGRRHQRVRPPGDGDADGNADHFRAALKARAPPAPRRGPFTRSAASRSGRASPRSVVKSRASPPTVPSGSC